MAQSKSLPLADVREVFQIVAECRELGDDPVAWRSHLLERLARLVGARVGMCGEFAPPAGSHVVPQVGFGWEGDQGKILHECLTQHIGKDELIWHRMHRDGGLLQTVRRCDYVPDREWYRQAYVQESFREADVDRLILSQRVCRSKRPTLDGIVLFRAWGERRFDKRECGLIALLHDEIIPLIGGPLASSGEPAPGGLAPRKQQVLESLLKGATDKQIATALHLSRPTVSEYVSDILRHFEVASRTELMAVFLQRFRKDRDLLCVEPPEGSAEG